jgi:VWFA-related protein
MAVFSKACWLSIAVAWSVDGQLPQPSPETVTRSESPTFRASTTKVEVPVVVRDGKGHTVDGLRSEDFRLFDNGKPQIISGLTELNGGNRAVSGGGSPATAENFTAYVLDDLGLPVEGLAFLRNAAIHHVTTTLGPADRAAILCTSGRFALDFTDDSAKLIETLRRFQIPSPQPTPSSVEEASQIIENSSRQKLDALREAIRRISAMPGQRRIVLASDGFLTSDFNGMVGRFGVLSIKVALLDYENLVMDEAIRARTVLNCLDPTGLHALDPLGYMRAKWRVLQELSAGTGGLLFKDNNDLDEGLRRLAAPPEHSYILAFSPQNLKYDGSFHSIKVSLATRKDVDIQARVGYFAPRKLNDPVETAREEIRDALFSREEIDDLPADLHTGFTRLGSGKARVNVQIHVDLKQMHFRKSDGRNLAELTVVVGLFDRNGIYVDGKQNEVALRLKDETFDQWMRSGIKLACNLDAEHGSYLVRLVVRDGEGRAMSGHNAAVEIP